jgi:hypothetical protein
MKTYPAEILSIAEQYILENSMHVKSIIPIYGRGFIVVIENDGETTFKPYIQRGIYLKNYIELEKSTWSFYNYDECLIALITLKNLGEHGTARTYIDIFCNKMGVTSHSNSINPNF